MPEPTGRPYPTQNHLGIVRLGLAVPDLARGRADLAARGTPVTDIEERHYGADVGTRQAVVARDPDGAVVELVDHPL